MQGDAFLARVFDNEDNFERLDFTLREVASSAQWVKEAAAQNEAKMRGDGAGSILRRMQVEGSLQCPCQQHPSAESGIMSIVSNVQQRYAACCDHTCMVKRAKNANGKAHV